MNFGGGEEMSAIVSTGLTDEDVLGDGCLLKAAAEDDLPGMRVMISILLSFLYVDFPVSPNTFAFTTAFTVVSSSRALCASSVSGAACPGVTSALLLVTWQDQACCALKGPLAGPACSGSVLPGAGGSWVHHL